MVHFCFVSRNFEIKLPLQTVNNGSLFLHAVLTKLMSFRDPTESVLLSRHTVTAQAYLTQHTTKKDKAYNLLQGSGEKVDTKSVKSDKPVTHWKTRLVLSGLHAPFSLYRSKLPFEIMHLFKLNNKQQYMPIIYLSEARQRMKDLVEVPSLKEAPQEGVSMPLEIKYEPITVGKLRFFVILENSFRTIKKFGFTNTDLEDVKAIFFDSNHSMMLTTMVIVMLHVRISEYFKDIF